MTIAEMNRARKEKNLTYEQISRISGVPISTVQKVFGGITGNPRKDTIRKLERALMEYGRPDQKMDINQDACDRTDFRTDGTFQNREMVCETGSVYNISGTGAAAGGDPEIVTNSGNPGIAGGSGRHGLYTLTDRAKLPRDRRTELLDGVLYDMAAPSQIHQSIAGSIYSQLYRDSQGEEDPECYPCLAPSDLHIDGSEYTVVQPDIYVICRQGKRVWPGEIVPSLVMEILSPSTKIRDMTVKMKKYLESGVIEYWMIDPEKRTVVVQNLGAVRGDPEWEKADEITIYGFDSVIPVQISRGKCSVDMREAAGSLDLLEKILEGVPERTDGKNPEEPKVNE